MPYLSPPLSVLMERNHSRYSRYSASFIGAYGYKKWVKIPRLSEGRYVGLPLLSWFNMYSSPRFSETFHSLQLPPSSLEADCTRTCRCHSLPKFLLWFSQNFHLGFNLLKFFISGSFTALNLTSTIGIRIVLNKIKKNLVLNLCCLVFNSTLSLGQCCKLNPCQPQRWRCLPASSCQILWAFSDYF